MLSARQVEAARRLVGPLATLAGLLAVAALVVQATTRPSRLPVATPAVPACRAPSTALPATLADTGLYADFAGGVVAADVQPFTPQYPLWSDGATKQRFLRLPPGTTIDARDPDAWVFPIGTQLWKEFRFGRRIETRYLERGADGAWLYATYAWNADGSAAPLAPERGIRGACESAPGIAFDIPARLDCRACHEGGRNRVLGFSALQLSPDRDPLAPHAETPAAGALDLDALLRRGLLVNAPPEWRTAPPRIAAATPRERAVRGYLHANCGQCHNSAGPLAALGLVFEQRVAPTTAAALDPLRATALAQPSRWRPAGARAALRLVAGAPDASTLLQRLATRDPLAQMPPLGTRRVDDTALALISGWIGADLVAAPTGPAVRNEAPSPIPWNQE